MVLRLIAYPSLLTLLASLHKTLYNDCMNVEVLRVLLIIFLLMMYLLTAVYLRRRKMSKLAYVLWGTFALLLPAFGPLFVIAYRPGELAPRKRSRQKSSLKRRCYIRK